MGKRKKVFCCVFRTSSYSGDEDYGEEYVLKEDCWKSLVPRAIKEGKKKRRRIITETSSMSG